jgi:CubicO group peptidase (beta-lactamase class C family)
MKSFYLSALFIFIANCLAGQSKSDTDLDKTVDSLVSQQFKQNEPGVSILIARKGKIVYEDAFGSANLELNVPMKTDMVFRIGSITKQFTAIGILQLVEQGKISLQDSIQKYIPFPSKGYRITIENLLTHTSGIVDYSNADTTHNPYIEREDFTPERMIPYFNYQPLEFEPGTKYNYSNSGYVLLAYVIEKVTGQEYHKYMQEHVINKAGLSNTLYASENTIVPGRVQGYTRDKGFYENCEYQTLSIGYGCGDLMSTTEDLFKWNNALLENKLVNKNTLEKAFTPFKLKNGSYSKYGYGWFIDTLNGNICIHHEGQVSGFIAIEKFFPQQNVFLSILTNVKSGEDKTDFSDKRFRLFEKITDAALGKKLENEITLSSGILKSYAGVYEPLPAYKGKKTPTITIYLENGSLYADLSNGTGRHMLLVAQTETTFILPDVQRIKTIFEFVKESGKTIKLIATQEKPAEFIKTKGIWRNTAAQHGFFTVQSKDTTRSVRITFFALGLPKANLFSALR